MAFPKTSHVVWSMAILAIACGGGDSGSPTAPSGLTTAPTTTLAASSIVASLDGQSPVGATAQATATASQLQSGGRLLPGQSLTSVDSRYRLLYQPDGNLVQYDDVGGIAMWNTGTAGSGAGQAVMQGDGNFVVYDAQGLPSGSPEPGVTRMRGWCSRAMETLSCMALAVRLSGTGSAPRLRHPPRRPLQHLLRHRLRHWCRWRFPVRQRLPLTSVFNLQPQLDIWTIPPRT